MIETDTKEKMVKKRKRIPKEKIKIESEEDEEDALCIIIMFGAFLQIQARPGLYFMQKMMKQRNSLVEWLSGRGLATPSKLFFVNKLLS